MTDARKTIDVNTAILEYYQLKQKYQTKIEIQKKKILKNKSLTLKQKQHRYQEMQAVCINCGQVGGTLFKNDDQYLTAVCGAATPCNLNIKIYRGMYKNIYTQEKELETELNKLKELVILIKLSLIFNLESKEAILDKFEKIKKDLSRLSSLLFTLQNKLLNITLKPQNKVILDTAYNDLFNSKESLKNIVNELKTTNSSRYARDAAELFISEIIPLTEKIRKLKYDYVDVEVKEENKNLNHYLIQSDYILNKLIQPVSLESSAKVISFIK